MTIWHKIIVALIFLTIPVNFFFACRTLKTHQVWRSKIVELEAKISQVEKETRELEYGSEDQTAENAKKGIREIVRQLDAAMFQRGRAWFDATAETNAATGVVTLEVLEPNPHNIVKDTILYCFDAAPKEEGGTYLGKFTVSQVEDTKIQLTPSMDMTLDPSTGEMATNSHLREKLTKNMGTWNLYEKMPRDERAMYAAMKEDHIRELMPESSANDFINDGKDDPNHPGMKYERPLRDYERIFDAVSSKTAKLDDLIIAATFDAAYAQSALEDAKKQETFQQNLIAQCKIDRTRAMKERDAVVRHLAVLNQRYALYQSKIQQVRADNIKLAKQIDAYQREAAKRIYSRVQKNMTASAM